MAQDANFPTYIQFHRRTVHLGNSAGDWIERILYVEPATAGELTAAMLLGGADYNRVRMTPQSDPILSYFYCAECSPIESVAAEAIKASPGTGFTFDPLDLNQNNDPEQALRNALVSLANNAEQPVGYVPSYQGIGQQQGKGNLSGKYPGCWLRAIYRPAYSVYKYGTDPQTNTALKPGVFDYLDPRIEEEELITPMAFGTWLDVTCAYLPINVEMNLIQFNNGLYRARLDGTSGATEHVEMIQKISIRSMYRGTLPQSAIDHMVGRINGADIRLGSYGLYHAGCLRCDTPVITTHYMPCGAAEQPAQGGAPPLPKGQLPVNNQAVFVPPHYSGRIWYEIDWKFSYKTTYDRVWVNVAPVGNPGAGKNVLTEPQYVTWQYSWAYPNARYPLNQPTGPGLLNVLSPMPWGYYRIVNNPSAGMLLGGNLLKDRGLYLYDSDPGPLDRTTPTGAAGQFNMLQLFNPASP